MTPLKHGLGRQIALEPPSNPRDMRQPASAGPLALADRAGGAEAYAIGRTWRRRRLLRLDRFGCPFLLLRRLRGTVSQCAHVEPARGPLLRPQFRLLPVQLDRQRFHLSVAPPV